MIFIRYSTRFVSDLVENLEDRFSHDATQIIIFINDILLLLIEPLHVKKQQQQNEHSAFAVLTKKKVQKSPWSDWAYVNRRTDKVRI